MLALCGAGITAVSLQVRCIDTAREVARLAARGDAPVGESAGGLAPRGAAVEVRRDGSYVIARVRARSAILPGLVIAGEAIALAEPGLR